MPPIKRILCCGLILIGSLAANAAPPGSAILEIGKQTQLLIDDYIVQSQSGLQTVQASLSPGRVVLTNDEPWEQRIFYPDVVRTGKNAFRMYYDIGLSSDPATNDVSVAFSSDGYHFKKPALRNVLIGGMPTNIVAEKAHGPGVAFEPGAGDEAYKLAYWMHGGMGIAFSADGLGFTAVSDTPVVPNKVDTKQSIVWDPAIHKWVWFTRFWEKPQDGRPGWTRFKGDIRAVARFESTDFRHWSGPEVVERRSPQDPLLSDYYGLQVTMRHGMMIGLLWTSDWDDTRGSVGRQRAALVISRDHGHSWTRIDRDKPFFELGSPGTFDSQIVWPTTIVTIGDRDLIYYQASRIEHAVVPVARFPHDAYSLAVRTLGYDRFVARRAGNRPGTLTSRPFLLPPGRHLLLNIDAGSKGFARAALLDAVTGRTLTESAPVAGDSYDSPVKWRTQVRLQPSGRPVRLRFTLENASLYAFTFR